MQWPKPLYSRSEVNRAGEFLSSDSSDPTELGWATEVLSNWRSCHGYPVNTFQSTLRKRLKTVDRNALVAQRLKRSPSILSKLGRFPSMKLSRMQDIGGLRAIVSNLNQIKSLSQFYKGKPFEHELVGEYDYINSPKSSGYRSLHLVYRYKNKIQPAYDGLLLELQLRTRHQHIWATAVETMGTFLNSALKSSEGPEDWLKFFALAGAGFAHLENTPIVPGFEHISRADTFKSITQSARNLNIRGQLQAFCVATRSITTDAKLRGTAYHLVTLYPSEKRLELTPFSRDQLESASHAYTETENRISQGEDIQVVLVSVGSLDKLRKAYPNYFLDSRDFISVLNQIEKIEEKLS